MTDKTPKELIQHILDQFSKGWMTEARLAHLGLTGSRGYGTHTPTSDYDLFGIVIPPVRCILGIDQWESYASVTEEIDIKLYSPAKFIGMMTSGSMNNLELLFMPSITTNPLLNNLFLNRSCFLTPSVLNSVFGYTDSTLKRFRNISAADHGSKRRLLIEDKGYDCKAATHCFRWIWMAMDLAENPETLTTDMHRGRKMFLNSVKHGDLPADRVEQLIIRWRDELKGLEAEIKEILPSRETMRAVANDCLVLIHKEIITTYG